MINAETAIKIIWSFTGNRRLVTGHRIDHGEVFAKRQEHELSVAIATDALQKLQRSNIQLSMWRAEVAKMHAIVAWTTEFAGGTIAELAREHLSDCLFDLEDCAIQNAYLTNEYGRVNPFLRPCKDSMFEIDPELRRFPE